MTLRGRCAGWFAAMLLAGCGGSGGGPGGVAVVGGGTPTPTPAATPTTAPTPAPAPSYAAVGDYTRAFAFTSALGYAVDRFEPDSGTPVNRGAYLLPAAQTARIDFQPAPEQIRFEYAGASVAFTGDQRGDLGAQRIYRNPVSARPDNELLVGPDPGRGGTYVTKVTWRTYLGAVTQDGVPGRAARLSFGLFGPAVVAGDTVPGSATYRGTSFFWGGPPASQITGRVDSTATLSLIAGGGTVTGVIALVEMVGDTTRSTALIIAATVDRVTGAITGTLASSDRTVTGELAGQLFGPQAAEVGLTFQARRGTGVDRLEIAGDFIGRR